MENRTCKWEFVGPAYFGDGHWNCGCGYFKEYDGTTPNFCEGCGGKVDDGDGMDTKTAEDKFIDHLANMFNNWFPLPIDKKEISRDTSVDRKTQKQVVPYRENNGEPVFGITARGNEAFYPSDGVSNTRHNGPQQSSEYEIFYGHICFGTKDPKGFVYRDYYTGLCSICKPSQPGINIAYFNKNELPRIRKTIEQFKLNE